ncbi:beta-1,4-galactosyltransferase 7 [Plakobranchus ocellatus]|uniref:Beta-1,4-galactosyltransferase n=1 Tax=Plakobranchus ocellatus TaxID=259542 RepID=A0AAV3YDR6_9GAST|nr:beta-1,4-galactosyltransferase 7 [Plakobranchus ocellatus]
MAIKFARLLNRVLYGGLLCTFVVASFWGISLVTQDNSILFSPTTPCKCDHQLNQLINIAGHEGNKKPNHSMCILVPYRDRFEELLEFAPHINTFLMKQNIAHKIVVINQLDKFRFNRASLINVGFLESRHDCDYIAMHDVDLLPVNEDLRYDFPKAGPHHLAAPHLHPLYHYETFVGGILLLQSVHFEKLNGLSNKYWGWGREDDEFFVRMKKAGLKLSRPGNLSSGYRTFKHIHDRKKRRRDHDKFFDQGEKTRRLDKQTGISNVRYTVASKQHLTVDGAPLTIINTYLECNVDFTPWCLQTEDHEWYRARVKEKSKKQQAVKLPNKHL